MTRRKRWVITSIVLGGLLVVGFLLFVSRIPISSETLRRKVIATLADRLDADVELRALRLHVFPRMHAEGEGLVIRHQGRRDVPPLISVRRLTVDSDLLSLWRRRVSHVTLDGLAVQIPPKLQGSGGDAGGNGSLGSTSAPTPQPSPKGQSASLSLSDVIIERLETTGATLSILPRRSDRPPRVWYLHTLRMQSLGARSTMPFDATITNAVPPGEIVTEGSFGPWNREDPGVTPLIGAFTLDQADLSVFKGISGMLSAKGSYGGSLERIEVRGETDTPDFMVNLGGHPVPLHAVYRAVVDGTNGNTTLKQVDASFLSTSLTAKGGVFHVKGVKGRLVTLDVTIDRGRLEDVIQLAVNAPKPPMTGALTLVTKFELPPGDKDVVEKLRLNGRFQIKDGRFTNAGVQGRVNELSQRARGVKNVVEPQHVESDFSGRFGLQGGTLSLQHLTFNVPGALVTLDGQYELRRETLAFKGNLQMDAKVSETMTGMKSLLLKVLDPLFRKNGRTLVPLKISGTRDKPSFGLDMGRVFKRDS